MIMPKPALIQFETLNDVVDYVSYGMIPKKTDFQQVMIRLKDPNEIPRDPSTKEVYIASDVVPDDPETRAAIASVLERVYHDRKKNRRNMLIFAGALAIAFIGGSMFISHCKNKREREEMHEYFMDHGLDCETVSVNCEI